MSNLAMVPVDGQLVGRQTPAELKAQVEEIRELMRSVLEEGTDYGRIPNTPKPTLFKSGAEWLLKWARYGHCMDEVRVDRDEDGKPFGVTYRCTVFADGMPSHVVATGDGYCGYSEPDREAHQSKYGKPIPRSPWNTVVQMAQKRALVSVTLRATASSGLFTQDVVAEPPEAVAPLPEPAPPAGFDSHDAASAAHKAMTARIKALPGDADRAELEAFRKSNGWPMPAGKLAELAGMVDVLTPKANNACAWCAKPMEHPAETIEGMHAGCAAEKDMEDGKIPDVRPAETDALSECREEGCAKAADDDGYCPDHMPF